MTAKNNDSLESLKKNITRDESEASSQNNSVLQKLLNSKINSGSSANKNKKATADQEPFNNMQKVVATRYKIYTFLVIILGRVVWSSFLSTAINTNDFTKQTVDDNQLKIMQLQNKLATYQRDQKFVALIEEQENSDAIYQCVNNDIDCDELPEDVLNELELVKAYLQIGNLYDKKMVIDEKSLLINLDAFMTKERRNGFPTERSNGEILELLIGDPEQIEQQLYQAQLDVQIEFEDKDALLSFINNVENRIIKGINASTVRSTPVLYKINQIEYDIVNYTEEQTVVVNMIAYYYQEERESSVNAGGENKQEANQPSDSQSATSLTVEKRENDQTTTTLTVEEPDPKEQESNDDEETQEENNDQENNDANIDTTNSQETGDGQIDAEEDMIDEENRETENEQAIATGSDTLE